MDTKGFLNAVRNSAAADAYIPLGAQMGWPVPQHRRGVLCAAVPFFFGPPGEERAWAIVATYPDGSLVEFRDLWYEEPMRDLREGAQASTMDFACWTQERDRAMGCYDLWFDALRRGCPPGPRLGDFRATMRALLEPRRLWAYRILGAAFPDDIPGEEA